MKIIAIEGLDKCGKYSQTKKLVEYLRLQKFKVEQTAFHRYDTPTGKLIQQWLTKKWNVDQATIELVMAADKQAQQHWFKRLEEKGIDFLILDRYTSSQVAYSVASGMELEWVRSLQKNMKKPDLEIFIDITVEESMKRKGKHNNGVNDRYEESRKTLEGARTMFTQVPHIVTIDGMRGIDAIHGDIVQAVQHLL